MVLLGEYGYISDFSIEPEVARENIRNMKKYGIIEFQFYDWFSSYTHPPDLFWSRWINAYNPSYIIRMDTLKAYIEEIHKIGGRAWAYIQSVAVDYDHDPCAGIEKCKYTPTRLNSNNTNLGFNYIIGKHSYRTYNPSQEWATRMVNVWGKTVKELGFDGIHWDSLGIISLDNQTLGFLDFLERSSQLLTPLGLLQTFNFVDLHWLTDYPIVKCCRETYLYYERFLKTVDFLYAEVWNSTQHSQYASLVRSRQRGVVAFYPSIDFSGRKDISDIYIQERNIMSRTTYSRENNLSYLIIGNGNRRLINEYFLNDTPVSETITKFLNRL